MLQQRSEFRLHFPQQFVELSQTVQQRFLLRALILSLLFTVTRFLIISTTYGIMHKVCIVMFLQVCDKTALSSKIGFLSTNTFDFENLTLASSTMKSECKTLHKGTNHSSIIIRVIIGQYWLRVIQILDIFMIGQHHPHDIYCHLITCCFALFNYIVCIIQQKFCVCDMLPINSY